MKRISFIAGIAGAACLIAGGAYAQAAGSFAGTSADGATISLNVSHSGSTYTITSMNVGMIAPCKKTGNTANEGWGFSLFQDITSGSADFTSHNDYYYTTGSMHFVGHTQIKGTITNYTATFVPGMTPPKQAQFCMSAKQAFTLNAEAPGKVQPLPATVDTGRLKPGR
jgi:hypothetical protein